MRDINNTVIIINIIVFNFVLYLSSQIEEFNLILCKCGEYSKAWENTALF